MQKLLLVMVWKTISETWKSPIIFIEERAKSIQIIVAKKYSNLLQKLPKNILIKESELPNSMLQLLTQQRQPKTLANKS